MNWKEYEKTVFEYLTHWFPEENINYNSKIRGKMSKSIRQVDILIDGKIAGIDIRVVIDSKSYKNKKVDVKAVESFLGMLADVDAHKGVLVTTKGYTKGAINRTFNDSNKDLDLEVLNFDELKELDGIGGIIHRGIYGMTIPAPFGWVINAKQIHASFLAKFYQRGLSFEEAAKNEELIYANIIIKGEEFLNLEEVIAKQESVTNSQFGKCTFEYSEKKVGQNRKVIIREIIYANKDYREITGFLDFDDFIFYLVLITPKELFNKNKMKLDFMLAKAIPMKVNR